MTNSRDCTQETVIMAIKEKPFERNGISFKSRTNNAIRTNYIKAKIDNILQKKEVKWLIRK